MLQKVQKVVDYLSGNEDHIAAYRPLLKHYGQDTRYTPDWMELCKRKRINVFVYSDDKKGQKWNNIVSETTIRSTVKEGFPCFKGYTVEPFYHWRKDLGLES